MEKGYIHSTLHELLNRDSNLTDAPVQVRGIIRGATATDKTIWAYLQEGDNFVQMYGKYLLEGMPQPTLALLRASSESGIEATVKGLFSDKTLAGHPGELRIHNITLNNVGIDFEKKDD